MAAPDMKPLLEAKKERTVTDRILRGTIVLDEEKAGPGDEVTLPKSQHERLRALGFFRQDGVQDPATVDGVKITPDSGPSVQVQVS